MKTKHFAHLSEAKQKPAFFLVVQASVAGLHQPVRSPTPVNDYPFFISFQSEPPLRKNAGCVCIVEHTRLRGRFLRILVSLIPFFDPSPIEYWMIVEFQNIPKGCMDQKTTPAYQVEEIGLMKKNINSYMIQGSDGQS